MELTNKFKIVCNKCGSSNIDYGHGEDWAYTEYVYIYCVDCDNEVKL